MARKKRIGRLHKNYEKKCQATNKNSVGHPSKCKKVKEQQTPENVAAPTVTFNEFDMINSIMLPSSSWNISHFHDHHIIYKVQEQSSSTQPLIISHFLTVKSDLSWSLSIYGQPVNSQCLALAESPDRLSCRELCNFVHKLEALIICPGHPAD